MAIDQVPEQENHPVSSPEGTNHAPKFLAIFIAIAALAFGEIYSLSKFGSLRKSLETEQAQIVKSTATDLSERYDSFARTNNAQLESLKAELEDASKRMGSTGKQFGRARALVTKLQKQQEEQAKTMKEELATKADQSQLLAVTQDVSATKTDLDGTKKNVDSLSKEFGMSKTEFGTLIARNHDEIGELRKLGERDYIEFALDRNKPQRVANVGLNLKKTNVKRHRFNLSLNADDMEIEKKDRTVNEPVFFYLAGTKKPYELVVNKVESNRIVGYISVPKGGVQVASRSEGAQ